MIPIIFIGKLFHRDHLIKIVFMARSHYTVLTFKNRIYNYTNLIVPSTRTNSTRLKNPCRECPSLSIRRTTSPVKTANSLACHFALRKQLFAALTFSFTSFVLIASYQNPFYIFILSKIKSQLRSPCVALNRPLQFRIILHCIFKFPNKRSVTCFRYL